jgi:hypothetical protein
LSAFILDVFLDSIPVAIRSIVVTAVAVASSGATGRAARIATTTAGLRGVAASAAASRRRATAVAPITVIPAIRITVAVTEIAVKVTVTVADVAAIVPVAVTVIPVAVIVTAIIVAVGVTSTRATIRVAVTTATVAHVLARGRRMRAVCHGVVDTDTTTIELNTVQLLDALSRILNGRHTDEAEATRPTRLLTRALSGQTRHSRGRLTRWSYTMVTFSTRPKRENSSSRSRSCVRILRPNTPRTLLGVGA